MIDVDMNEDAIVALADLVGRTGANSFEIGHTEGDPATWYAVAFYRGARLIAQDRHTPTEAAMGLAERLLSGATCRCRRTVSLSDRAGDYCRWRLQGPRWEPGCDAPSISMPAGTRGDMDAMRKAIE